jgi:hypothetical protein
MATCRELHDKYSTGIRHTSPTAVEYPDGAFRSSFLCSTHLGDIMREYMDHLYYPPTSRCKRIPPSYDGVIRTDILDVTDEELEWASVEYILRESINKCFGSNHIEFIITVKEN